MAGITLSYMLCGCRSAVMGCPRWVPWVVVVSVDGRDGSGGGLLDGAGAGSPARGRGWKAHVAGLKGEKDGMLMVEGTVERKASTSDFVTFSSIPMRCKAK